MRNLVTIIFIMAFLPCIGQNQIENDSFVTDSIVELHYGLPIVRATGGGSKILVQYEGNWTNEMKGAFEYACKIVEESLPTTYPIKINAVLDTNRSTSNLSKITTYTYPFDTYQYNVFSKLSTQSQIKGTTFAEMAGIYDTSIYGELLIDNMFVEPDITLTYYNKNGNIETNCSFAIDENLDSNLYDFVSIVMRDIIRGLGITSFSPGEVLPANGTLTIGDNITPFQKHIRNALNYSNVTNSQAYINATQGSLTIGNANDGWVLYAPTTWDLNRSLCYFIPNENNRLTQVLSYDFGRGSLTRNISDGTLVSFCRDILHWKGDVTTGTGGSYFGGTTTSTGDVVPLNGQISLTGGVIRQNSNLSFVPKMLVNQARSTNADDISYTTIMFMYSLHPNYRPADEQNPSWSIDRTGWTVSLLKKDGTWDIVYETNTYSPYFTVSTENFTLHSAIEDYARTCDGYLRCRVTEAYNSQNTVKGDSYYYVLDYLPQKIQMAKSRVMPVEDEADYYRDVQIGLKDIEGTTRIVVAQLDEGNAVPYYYEVPDFKKGYFTATVDREYTSTFTITAYNSNGSTESYPYVLTPLTPVTSIDLGFTLDGDAITVHSNTRNLSDKQLMSSYQINRLSSNQVMGMPCGENCRALSASSEDKNMVDVSSLDRGMYVLTVTDIKGGTHSFKFLKE